MEYHILPVLQRAALVMMALFLLSVHAPKISGSSVDDNSLKRVSTTNPRASKPNANEVDPAARASIEKGYGNLPLSFEANTGQVDDAVRFLSRGNG